MNDPRSPLAQRVRRLLVRGGGGAVSPPHRPHPGLPQPQHPVDSGLLFESQLARLSTTLRDLRAIDRQREAELRALRERLAIADAVAQAAFAARLVPALARIDAMLEEVSALLQPPEPPPSATLFERMRSRRATALSGAQRETLLSWAGLLADLRVHLATMVEE